MAIVKNRQHVCNSFPLGGGGCYAAKGYEQNHDFRLISRFISETIRVRAMATVRECTTMSMDA